MFFYFNFIHKKKIFLIVVIGIVISFVGDALRLLLDNRRQLILANLDEADKKAQKAQEKLAQIKSQFEAAKIKAQEIRNQGLIKIDQDKTNIKIQAEEIIQKLGKLKEETLLFQQQKTLKLLSKKVIKSSLMQVQNKLQNCVNPKFQKAMNNFYIALFRNYESSANS